MGEVLIVSNHVRVLALGRGCVEKARARTVTRIFDAHGEELETMMGTGRIFWEGGW